MISSNSNDDRKNWANVRAHMESGDEKHTPDGRHRTRHWSLFKIGLTGFEIFLKATRLYERGVRNALNIELRQITLEFDNLPAAFDGYRILQISDPHVDAMPALCERITQLARAADADLCVLTGDYRFRVHGDFTRVTEAFGEMLPEISTRDGTVAILGNHDTAEMVPMFEALDVRVLVNQTISITRDDAMIHVTGLDDAYYYYTEAATDALENAPSGFRVALVHSPELIIPAAKAGIDLYLTGHTHGGQVCLPGGYPLITHSLADKHFASGLWKLEKTTGYTSRGAGVSGLPVRFNCPGEITVFTLKSTN
jgi:predicted MPP superfamily phosphohydrolase